MSVSRRNALRIFGLGAGAVALAACAPSGGNSSSSGSGSLKDDGVKKFPLTGWSINEAVTKAPLRAAIDKYSAANGVTISTPSYPYNDFLNQVLLQIQGGQVSGVVQCDVAWLATLAATGKLADVSGVVKGADYTPSALSLGKSKGVQYGLPWTAAGIGLIANQGVLDKAGVSAMPTTITEFEAALVKIKKQPGIIPYAGMTKVDQLKDIIAWMWQFGSPVVDSSGAIVVGDAPSVEALTWYKKLYDQKLMAPDINRFDARALMSQGKVAFYEDAIGGRATVTEAATDPTLGEKLVPLTRPVKNAGDDPRHLAWGGVFVIVNGDGASAAADFAKTITTDLSYTTPWFEKTGLPPATTSGLADPKITGDAFASAFTQRIGQHVTQGPFWIYPQFSQMEKVLAEEVQAILIGKKQPKAALDTARERMTALIK